MFGFIKKGLQKTAEAMRALAPTQRTRIPKEELEEILLESDVEYDLIELMFRELPDKVSREQLESKLLATMAWIPPSVAEEVTPRVDLIIGVNGAGKTTTIAKLARHYKVEQSERVMLAAGDTFRAAAIEQLKLWADRLDLPIVSTRQGHDASAVAYDAIESAKARGLERVLIDTAGRLQTKSNLNEELKKIVRICGKAMAGAPHRKLLILDGTQGNAAISQAHAFHEMVGVDGVIITKLDGTAKGGAIFSIAHSLQLPILFIGVGEQPDDLVPFDKKAFVKGFLDPLFETDEEEAEA